MKLSKKEAKARMKLIQENHYDKEEQRILDEAAAEMPRSYADLYEMHRHGGTYWYNVVIANRRIGRAARALGQTAEEAAEGLRVFAGLAREAEQCST